MDLEVKQLVEENLRLSKENNELLLKLYNIQKWSQMIRIGYYIVIVLIGIGAFYFIKPFLGDLFSAYGLDTSSFDVLTK